MVTASSVDGRGGGNGDIIESTDQRSFLQMELLIGSGISNPKINFQFHVYIICFMTKEVNLRNEYRIGTLPFMLRFANYEGYV